MAKESHRVFFKLPIRNSAHFATLVDPLVAQPAGSPAVLRVPNQKPLVAVSGYFGVFSYLSKKLNAMQGSRSGGP